jgi:hypothetical protein
MGAVLQAKDVGLLVGLTEDAVKQWTLGRPYAIRPSIRLSTGKGIPNLYSLTDALRFAVVTQLTADGFQSHVIQRALSSFDATAKTLLISRRVGGGEPEAWFSKLPMLRLARQEESKTRKFAQRSFYVLDVESLRDWLERLWTDYVRKGSRELPSQGAKSAKEREKKP